MTAEPLAHKDENASTFVLPPSEELARLVMRLRSSRPVWRVGDLAAPRIEWVAAPGPIAIRPLEIDRDRRPYFRHGALLALETNFEPLVIEQLQPDERKQLRKMYAALMRDVQGSSLETIMDELGGERPGFADEAAARRQVAAGRRLWRRLPAWPWSWFGTNGRPPGDWRTAGPDATLAAALASWATDRPTLPASS